MDIYLTTENPQVTAEMQTQDITVQHNDLNFSAEIVSEAPVEAVMEQQVLELELAIVQAGEVRGIETVKQAGEIISALRFVKSGADGKIYICDSTNINDADLVIGITTSSALADGYVRVTGAGFVSDSSWNWDTTKVIRFDNLGRPTQDVPLIGFNQIVAVPVTPTMICITLKNAIKLI
jgi:hypothetical protein